MKYSATPGTDMNTTNLLGGDVAKTTEALTPFIRRQCGYHSRYAQQVQ